MDTNRHESPRRRFHEFSYGLFAGIQSVLIHEIRVCKVNDSWSFVPLGIRASAVCAIYSERAFSSSPRDAGVGRRPRRGETSQIVPPLPGPTAIELSELRQDRSADFSPLPAVLAGPERCGLKSALLNSMAVLPGPLLHSREERESLRLRLCRAESIRGFSPRTFDGNR